MAASAAATWGGSAGMNRGIRDYHLRREQQCRQMALGADCAEARQRHEQLAELHAQQAARLAEPAL
jgi:hypothetical protein